MFVLQHLHVLYQSSLITKSGLKAKVLTLVDPLTHPSSRLLTWEAAYPSPVNPRILAVEQRRWHPSSNHQHLLLSFARDEMRVQSPNGAIHSKQLCQLPSPFHILPLHTTPPPYPSTLSTPTHSRRGTARPLPALEAARGRLGRFYPHSFTSLVSSTNVFTQCTQASR
ncbi:hypothetical protein EJ06DRAFT_407410 [Trichodelitschia bisporula]|uniref:Uncharacterized protein n=1 Tax=Trichodelitschia bisporula TaxID=703511 RepID=A0A6G1HXL6_9PEZI|nr:hypothetical protein EJ06DRAFT_407410 [Trichodelitschia bisporula]